MVLSNLTLCITESRLSSNKPPPWAYPGLSEDGCAVPWYVGTQIQKIETFFPLVRLPYIFLKKTESHRARYVKSINFQGTKRHRHRQPFCCVLKKLKGVVLEYIIMCPNLYKSLIVTLFGSGITAWYTNPIFPHLVTLLTSITCHSRAPQWRAKVECTYPSNVLYFLKTIRRPTYSNVICFSTCVISWSFGENVLHKIWWWKLEWKCAALIVLRKYDPDSQTEYFSRNYQYPSNWRLCVQNRQWSVVLEAAVKAGERTHSHCHCLGVLFGGSSCRRSCSCYPYVISASLFMSQYFIINLLSDKRRQLPLP